jgi:protein involved in polysaccharide export with SLBB domain
MWRAAGLAALLCALLVTAPGAQAPAQPSGDGSYQLVPGDVVDFKFRFNPDLNESVTVRPDGFISLGIIGEVRAGGLTPAELSRVVQARYAEYLREPEVTAIVREFEAQLVYVGGEVVTPGLLPLRGRVTSLQAILGSGGPRPTARLTDVVLIRALGGDRVEARKLNLADVIAGRAADVPLEPHDVVFVPRSRIAKVGLFVEQYINSLVPRALVLPYNLNNVIVESTVIGQ